MNSRLGRSIGVLSWILVVAVSGTAGSSQKGSETFTASATVKTAGGATASAPVTITVDRMMPENEAKSLLNAFTSGGAEGLRKAVAFLKESGLLPLEAFVNGFTRLSSREVAIGYMESFVVTDLVMKRVGAQMGILLQNLSRGQSVEASLRLLGVSVDDLEGDLKQVFGRP